MTMMNQNTIGNMGISGDESQPEDKITRTVEQQTRKIPSILFLSLAGASLLGSLTFKVMGQSKNALFVGQWVPTFLLLGVYNKIVKEER